MLRARTDLIVVHCAATPPGVDIGAAEIDGWHKAKGWRCIGYHYVIRRSGAVEEGRPVEEPGAHAVEVNDRSVGVCLVGGVDDKGAPANNFTEAQFAALRGVLRLLSKRYHGARIIGHRDIPGVKKACPSFDVRAWLATWWEQHGDEAARSGA